MEEKYFNLKAVVLGGVVTLVVTAVAGMFLFLFQIREPRLVYSVTDTVPFLGDEENLATYHITVQNDGKRIIKNVVCQVDVRPGTITKKVVRADPTVEYNEEVSNQTYRVKFDNLNPNETVMLSLLASSDQKLARRPQISLRGEGIMGEERKTYKKLSPFKSTILPAVAATYAGFIAFFLMRKWRYLYLRPVGRLMGLVDNAYHSGNQNEVFAYLFGIHGMTEEAENYLKRPSKGTYWSEADMIAALAIRSQDSSEVENRKKVLIELLYYAIIAPSSVGLVHYNIARIAKFQQREEECGEHLEEAKKYIPRLVTKRLKLDPVFAS